MGRKGEKRETNPLPEKRDRKRTIHKKRQKQEE